MPECLACGQEVNTQNPAGWSGRHRYGCIGPSTWRGILSSSSGGVCWCGSPGVVEINRGITQYYACSAAHARKRSKVRPQASPFAVFAVACYPNGLPKDTR